jgi:hypothetical protein
MSWWKWGKLFPRILIVALVSRYEQEKSKDELWKLYNETDSISYRAVILSRLLILRLKYFESKIAESENYPHEVVWDDFGDEMFELLAMSEDLISTLICKSEVMEEFLKPDHIKELKKLEEIKRQLKEK